MIGNSFVTFINSSFTQGFYLAIHKKPENNTYHCVNICEEYDFSDMKAHLNYF